jgi:hypothetical protein
MQDTGLKAMMTEPTPLFLQVLLLISLKRKTLKHKDHKEEQSHKRFIWTKIQKYTKMKNLNSTLPTPSPLCSKYSTSLVELNLSLDPPPLLLNQLPQNIIPLHINRPREIQRECSKDPWLGQTTNDILRITEPSLPVPSLP